jgi:hypothetical protein
MIIPGTVGDLLASVLLILPGFVFTAVRWRLQGPTPADGDFSQRVLTVVVVGAVLDALYVFVGGRHITSVLTSRHHWETHTRELVLLGAVLLLVVPAVFAVLDDLRRVGKLDISIGSRKIPLHVTGRYDPTPTAWDFAGPPRGGTFVRVRQDGGTWTGGWFGADSYLSTWPEPRDLFIESQWRMNEDGQFVERVEGTRGAYVSCSGNVIVEWVDPPADDDAPEGGE